MQIKTYENVFGKPLTIGDLVNGYSEDNNTGRIQAFGGKLNVRPEYQREFIYEDKKQQAVIETVMNGYPLNVMYWAKPETDSNCEYEVLDGQQRIISICKFYINKVNLPTFENGKRKNRQFHLLDEKQKEKFLNYPLIVYICDGDYNEKIAWFRVINIAGLKLTEQEMRNAIYKSKWLLDAKKYFSNVKGLAFKSEGRKSNGHTYGDYVDVIGSSISDNEKSIVRQRLLEIVLSWAVDEYNNYERASDENKIDIDEYMRLNRRIENAEALWKYYEDVMEWIKETFKNYDPIMKNVEWGLLYNKYHNNTSSNASAKVAAIMQSADEITNKKEIYQAVLSDDMKLLNARSFTERDKRWAYDKQKGICKYCNKKFEFSEMHGDHIVPWSKGGETDRDNLQMLCIECNLKKSNYDVSYTPWDNNEYRKFSLEKCVIM